MVAIKALDEYEDIDFESKEWTLYDYIDPDALNRIFSRNKSEKVAFKSEGVTVTIRKDDGIHARVTEHREGYE